MQCSVAKAVGAQLVLHIFIEGFTHRLAKFNIFLGYNFQIRVYTLLYNIVVIGINTEYHISCVNVFWVILPLLPLVEPSSVSTSIDLYLDTVSALWNTHAQSGELAAGGCIVEFYNSHIATAYVQAAEVRECNAVISNVNIQARVAGNINLNQRFHIVIFREDKFCLCAGNALSCLFVVHELEIPTLRTNSIEVTIGSIEILQRRSILRESESSKRFVARYVYSLYSGCLRKVKFGHILKAPLRLKDP